MSTTPDTSASVDDRVAIETPRRNIRVGTVVDVEWRPSIAAPDRYLVVDVDGYTFRVAERDAQTED